jgi:hypothetical protein
MTMLPAMMDQRHQPLARLLLRRVRASGNGWPLISAHSPVAGIEKRRPAALLVKHGHLESGRKFRTFL